MYRKITSGTKKVMIYKYLNNFLYIQHNILIVLYIYLSHPHRYCRSRKNARAGKSQSHSSFIVLIHPISTYNTRNKSFYED